MFDINTIKQELINQGKDPEDYDITIDSNGYTISQKWYTPYKELYADENKMLKEKLAQQDAVIEDLVFNIIPSLGGGM